MNLEKTVERAEELLLEFGKLDEEIQAYKVSGKHEERKKEINLLVEKVVGDEKAFSMSRNQEAEELVEKKKRLDIELKTAARKGERKVLEKLKDELNELEIDLLIAQNQAQFKPDEIELFAKAKQRKSILLILKEESDEQNQIRDAVSSFTSISTDMSDLTRRITNRTSPGRHPNEAEIQLRLLGLENLMSAKVREFFNRTNYVYGDVRKQRGTHEIISRWIESNEDVSLEEFAVRRMKDDAEREKQRIIEETQRIKAKGNSAPGWIERGLEKIEYYLE